MRVLLAFLALQRVISVWTGDEFPTNTTLAAKSEYLSPESLATSDETIKIRYGDAISFKHIVSGGSVSLMNMHEDWATLVSSAKEHSFFRLLHRDGQAEPAQLVRKGSKVLLEDINTGKIIVPSAANGTTISLEAVQVNLTSDEKIKKKYIWSFEEVMGNMGDRPLKVGMKFMLRSLTSEVYMHTEHLEKGVMRIHAKQGSDDGNSIFGVESLIVSDQVPSIPVVPKITMIAKPVTIKYGDVITLKNFVSQKDIHLFRKAGADHAHLLAGETLPSQFRVLDANGKAEKPKTLKERSKITLQDVSSGQFVMMFDNGNKLKIKLGTPKKMNEARFMVQGVFGSLNGGQTLTTSTKFSLLAPKFQNYMRVSTALAGEQRIFLVTAGKGSNGNDIFVAQTVSAPEIVANATVDAAPNDTVAAAPNATVADAPNATVADTTVADTTNVTSVDTANTTEAVESTTEPAATPVTDLSAVTEVADQSATVTSTEVILDLPAAPQAVDSTTADSA